MIRKTSRSFETKSPAMINDMESFSLFLKRKFGAFEYPDGWAIEYSDDRTIEGGVHIEVIRGNIFLPDFSIVASDVDKWLDDAILSVCVFGYTSKLKGSTTETLVGSVWSRVLGRLPNGKIVLAHPRPSYEYIYDLVFQMCVYNRDNIVTFPVEEDAMTEQINKVISDYKYIVEQTKRILEERLNRWCQDHPDCDPDAKHIEYAHLKNESRNRRTVTRSRRSFGARMSRRNESASIPYVERGLITVEDYGQNLLTVAQEICDAFGEEGFYVTCRVDMSRAEICIDCAPADGFSDEYIGKIGYIGSDTWEFHNALTGDVKTLRCEFPYGADIFSEYDVDLMTRNGFYATEESRNRVMRRNRRR